MDQREAVSGLIPSASIAAILFAISRGAVGVSTLIDILPELDAKLWDYFQSNQDPEPLLDGVGDGLLVVNWEHHCIESFQQYQPLLSQGTAYSYSGSWTIEEPAIPYHLGSEWQLLDHYFEEV